MLKKTLLKVISLTYPKIWPNATLENIGLPNHVSQKYTRKMDQSGTGSFTAHAAAKQAGFVSTPNGALQ